ncbi:hypothetical protein FEM48_Zijuj08G0134900 [Ziziphus jujuba var. spinosa]|uniref:Uncharacterized protein n=1 Tax=Ziziphus jujuba var. spinosa TaxID=714518 RepID=A0A978UZD6_ZIZJJ|nr:hypothetical protein FEM48_Zijuj08G0134900 [Ziziphus jujuba var. spinosa]
MATINPNMFDKLSDSLLFIILTFLPFKEAARTSILSKRWRHIWRATSNMEFNERFFVKPDDFGSNREIQRRVFIDFAKQWMESYQEPVVKNFSLTFSRPLDEPMVLDSCVRFALAHNVKELGLDFSDPQWEKHNLDCYTGRSYDLPLIGSVYEHRVLESLKLFSCNFNLSGLCNLHSLRHLSLGWIGLNASNVKDLLVNCKLLESLSLVSCHGLDYLQIEGQSLQLKSLVIDSCEITSKWLLIEAPKLRCLKFVGWIGIFEILVKNCMEEAYLDFGYEYEFGELGEILYKLLDDLYPVKVLTVCSYMLQVIPCGVEPLSISPPLNVKHLTLRTALHDNEFYGIKFMLKSCPSLETLTIEIDNRHRIFPDYVAPFKESWEKSPLIVYKCMCKSLKWVEIKGFKGTYNEAYLLRYVIYFGLVMEKLNIYISKEVDASGTGSQQVYLRRAQQISEFKKTSPRLQISIFD